MHRTCSWQDVAKNQRPVLAPQDAHRRRSVGLAGTSVSLDPMLKSSARPDMNMLSVRRDHAPFAGIVWTRAYPPQRPNFTSMKKLATIALVTQLGLACSSSLDLKSCQQGCEADERCWMAECICVPQPDSEGSCPAGYEFNLCGTSACRYCRDCIPACLPESLLEKGSRTEPIGAECESHQLSAVCTCQTTEP